MGHRVSIAPISRRELSLPDAIQRLRSVLADRYRTSASSGRAAPHILRLSTSGEVGGTAYWVMPLVEGESLRDRLRREKLLQVADAVRIATEIAAAPG